MTKLLEEAFVEASKLTPEEQDLLAYRLLEDIAAEEKWEQAFGGSRDELATLADEAIAEHRAGKTKKLEEVLH